MSEPVRKPATYEDVLAAPESVVAEIIAGQLTTSPRPGAAHARASSRLGDVLGGPFDRGHEGPGGWVILDEPELHLDADILVPDLAGWRRERMPVLPEVAFFDLSPDWCCEILSASTRRLDRVGKLPIYAREHVRHVWLIDPEAKTLEVFALDGDSYRLVATHADDETVQAAPFEAVPLQLGLLWSR